MSLDIHNMGQTCVIRHLQHGPNMYRCWVSVKGNTAAVKQKKTPLRRALTSSSRGLRCLCPPIVHPTFAPPLVWKRWRRPGHPASPCRQLAGPLLSLGHAVRLKASRLAFTLYTAYVFLLFFFLLVCKFQSFTPSHNLRTYFNLLMF